MTFRDLTADDIEVRVQSVKLNADKTPKGALLLLYKTARTDMAILDEAVGAENWQDKFYETNGIMFCSIGINTNHGKPDAPDRWVWKSDAGTESNQDAEKGNASDARKRAGFAWGIGRELYTAPLIWVSADKCRINNGKCHDRFEVEKIAVENKRIVGLSIINSSIKADNIKEKRCFVWSLK